MRAREAATLLLAALDRDEMVARFLDVYAAQNRRPGRADHPVFYRDQLATIRRESILAMVQRIEAALPARLKVSVTVRSANRPRKAKKGKKSKKTKPARNAAMELAIPFLDLFREEFFVALGRRSIGPTATPRNSGATSNSTNSSPRANRRRPAQRVSRTAASGPFVDRVAMLLDPSLMEQARRAAGAFQLELNAAADRILRKTFARHHGA